MRPTPFALVALAAVTGLIGCECQPADPEPQVISQEPTPAGKPAPAPRPEGLHVTPFRFGALSSSTAATVEAVDAKLADKYTVRAAGPDAVKGATVEILLGEDVVAEVWPTPDGSRIEGAWSRHGHVLFPWNTRLGIKMGAHKNWSKMACAPAEARFAARARCAPVGETRIGYLLELQPEEAKTFPTREQLAERPIVGMVWTPDAPTADPKAAGDGKPSKAPLVIDLQELKPQ